MSPFDLCSCAFCTQHLLHLRAHAAEGQEDGAQPWHRAFLFDSVLCGDRWPFHCGRHFGCILVPLPEAAQSGLIDLPSCHICRICRMCTHSESNRHVTRGVRLWASNRFRRSSHRTCWMWGPCWVDWACLLFGVCGVFGFVEVISLCCVLSVVSKEPSSLRVVF